MDSKLARGHVSKLLLEVAIDLGLNLIIKIYKQKHLRENKYRIDEKEKKNVRF